MKRFAFAVALVATVTALLIPGPRPGAEEEKFAWLTDFDAAFASAAKAGKPLLLVFRCETCKDCSPFDGVILDPPPEFREAAKDYVCLRVVNMRNVDLNVFRLDFDLTLNIVLMNADGTIYHRYCSRDEVDPAGRLSMKGLTEVLRRGLETHRAYAAAPNPPPALPRRTIGDSPAFKERTSGGREPSCVHCHVIHDMEQVDKRAAGSWTDDDLWIWPLPDRLGIRLSVDDPGLIVSVAAGSAAAAAGVRAGDRLREVAGKHVMTETDVQAVLRGLGAAGGELRLAVDRGSERIAFTLALAPGWKEVTPLQYSWRPYLWRLRPNPGFGGKLLDADEKKNIGVDLDAFAVRITYVIDFGDHPEDGRNALKAGVAKDDILLSAGGVADFRNEMHFQAWYRLTRKPGDTVDLVLLRDGKRVTVTMTVLP